MTPDIDAIAPPTQTAVDVDRPVLPSRPGWRQRKIWHDIRISPSGTMAKSIDRTQCHPRGISAGYGGFSLIELLIAASLLIIAIIATGQMIHLSWHFKSRTDVATKAMELAASRAECLRPRVIAGDSPLSGSATILPAGKTGLACDLTWSTDAVAPGFWSLEVRCTPRNLPRKEAALKLYISENLRF